MPMCDGKEMTSQQETHFDIFNIDSSTSNQESGDCTCPAYKILGFEIFEIIILTLVCIGIIVLFIRMGSESKNWIQKWKDMKTAREEKKYRDYANKFGASVSSNNPGPKSANKTRKRNNSGKLSYEKGDPVEEYYNHSDEDLL